MAPPNYTTDLADIDLCEAGGKTWAEPTAVGWTYGAGPASDDDNPFQGALAMSKAFNATGVGGILVNNAAGVTIPTDGAFMGWFFWAPPAALESDANGGIRFMCGTDLANFLSWDVGGATSYAYGGWVNFAVNTTITPDDTVGTGLGNSQYFGAAVNCINSIFKGSPFLCDAFRYGRGEARMNGGEAANYATFAGFAATNDAVAYRWGLFQAIAGGYLAKGLMVLGHTSAVDFRDSNKNILIQNTNKVTANFNTIEVRQAGSRVDWTGIQITALGTISKGRFLTTDNADVNFDTCTFTDMNTFLFMSGATILSTTFRRCGIVTQGGAVFTGCKFDNAAGAKALVVDAVALVTNTEFISDGTGYALEGFSAAGNYDLTNLTFTGYAAGNGTTGNEAIHVLATSGIVNLVRTGGTLPSIHTEGATVAFPSSVTLTMTVKNEAGAVIVGAFAFIDQAIPETPWIMNTTTNGSGVATATWTGGSVSGATWRVRKYGYKNYKQAIDIGTSNISIPITLVADPQQI